MTEASRIRALGSRMREEEGQILPWLVIVMIALIGAGVLVMWLGLSSSISTSDQTAADAAAVAGEQSVNSQWNTLIRVGGVLVPQDSFDPALVQQAAQRYASYNDGTVTSIEYCTQGAGCTPQQGPYASEPDVLVTVASNQTMPKGSVSPGSGATTQARASIDPYAQPAPPVKQVQTSTQCDPAGTPPPNEYRTPNGDQGFFEASHTDFGSGCEPQLAAHLDALARAKGLGLHLVGVWGAGANDPNGHAGAAGGGSDPVSAAHACGQIAQVQGLTSAVTDAVLGRYSLARFLGHADQIELASPNARCSTVTTIPNQGANNQPVSLGNGKVHLVPLAGGPEGAIPLGIGAIPTAGGACSPCTQYASIYQQLAAQYGWNQAQLQDWYGVEKLEDAQGLLGGDPVTGGFGLAQFHDGSTCQYGPGSCPAANPTPQQELESMALYIHDRYGDPAAALAHEYAYHWY